MACKQCHFLGLGHHRKAHQELLHIRFLVGEITELFIYKTENIFLLKQFVHTCIFKYQCAILAILKCMNKVFIKLLIECLHFNMDRYRIAINKDIILQNNIQNQVRMSANVSAHENQVTDTNTWSYRNTGKFDEWCCRTLSRPLFDFFFTHKIDRCSK